MVSPFRPKVPGGQPVQVVINELKQQFLGSGIAAAGVIQK